jgi:hypothetical protein
MICYLSIRASHYETLRTAFPVIAVPLAASLWTATICDVALSAVLAPALRDGHQTSQTVKITLIARKDYDIGDDMLGAAAGREERQARPQRATGARRQLLFFPTARAAHDQAKSHIRVGTKIETSSAVPVGSLFVAPVMSTPMSTCCKQDFTSTRNSQQSSSVN